MFSTSGLIEGQPRKAFFINFSNSFSSSFSVFSTFSALYLPWVFLALISTGLSSKWTWAVINCYLGLIADSLPLTSCIMESLQSRIPALPIHWVYFSTGSIVNVLKALFGLCWQQTAVVPQRQWLGLCLCPDFTSWFGCRVDSVAWISLAFQVHSDIKTVLCFTY